MKVAVYPGSFDPITNGHLDILKRSLGVFDKVYLLLAVNPNKQGNFSIEERLNFLKEATKGLENVVVDYYEGLTVDYCKKVGANHIIRGLRAVTDFEYEFQLSSANRFIDEKIDMVFFMSSTGNTFISSSMVMEFAKNGVDVSTLVPEVVAKAFKEIK